MKKIIFILSILLIVSFGFSKEYNTGLTTVQSPQLAKVLADNPERSMINIGNWGYWLRDNGESAHTPGGNSGGFYPRGTAAAIYLDGVLVGGYQNGNLKVSGQIYRTGTERGYILNGEHMTQAKDPRVRLYRIRKDWETLTANQVRQDAAELAETEVGQVTDAQIQTVLDQYERDWNEWPTELGAPFYDLNNNGIYEPDQGETPGIANADQVMWFVITDANETTTRDLYGTDPIGIEQQNTLWAYNQPGAGLGQIVFKQVRLINKGDGDLEDAYISIWSDPDVGDYSNDLVGVDVDNSLMYVYNGVANDDHYDEFGLAPPAAGYDFFAGPIVEAPGETAIFDLKERAGYMNLPASSFGYFVAGGVYSDPDPYGNVEAAREYYNLMRGFAPLDDLNNPTPWLDPNGNPTLFPFDGDPVAGTGYLDSVPADRRMLINSGPFVLAEGDTQDIVVALVGGLGDNNLSSITAMKNTDVIAQKLFDDLFKSVPSAPAAPRVATTVTEDKVVLEWGSDTDGVIATETNPTAGYAFQGYNVYQMPNSTASKDQSTLVATYDKIDGVQTINGKIFLAEYGTTVEVPVQFGLDNGIVRSFEVDKNYITGGPLYTGSDYYFAVTAYNYNPAPDLIEDQALESPLTPILVTLAPAPVGTEFGAMYGDEIEAAHSSGGSDGRTYIDIVDPMALTGHDYRVIFGTEDYYRDVDGVWKMLNGAGKESLAKILDCSGSDITVSALASSMIGTIDLTFHFDMHCGSNWVDGIKLMFPAGVTVNSWDPLAGANYGQNPDDLLGVFDAATNTLFYGNDSRSTFGAIEGSQSWVVNIQPADFPLNIGFEVYDDVYDGTSVDAVGTATATELGYVQKTIEGWYAYDQTAGKFVTPLITIQSGNAGENITDGKLIPAGPVGAGENPIVDGMRINVDGPALTMKWIGVTANAAGPIDPPVDGLAYWRYPDWLIAGGDYTNQQTNGSTWVFNTHPGYGAGGPETFMNSLVVFSGGNGSANQGIAALIPDDFEFRFTGNGRFFDNWGDGWFSQPAPFEVWNIGSGTPDDASDDYKLITWLLDDDGNGVWGLKAEDHETSSADNDPYTDRVYVHAPTDDTPGTVGHDNWWAAMEAGGSQASWVAGPGSNDPGGPLDTWNVMSRTVFMNWNGGDVTDPTFPANVNALEPEQGTVFRFVTTKPNTEADVFSWTAPVNSESDALAEAAVKKVNVYPNPYYANNAQETNRFDNFVTFTHLPQKAHIKIFSLDGKIIRNLEKDDDSQYLRWDLRNHTNLPVASGVYIAHIDMDVDGQGLGSKILKLSIIQANQIIEYY